MRVLKDSMDAWGWTGTRMTGASKTERIETRKTGSSEALIRIRERKMETMIKNVNEMVAGMGHLGDEMSLLGLRTRTAMIFLPYRKTATAMATDLPIEAGAGEKRIARIEVIEASTKANEAIVVGIGTENNAKSESQNG